MLVSNLKLFLKQAFTKHKTKMKLYLMTYLKTISCIKLLNKMCWQKKEAFYNKNTKMQNLKNFIRFERSGRRPRSPWRSWRSWSFEWRSIFRRQSLLELSRSRPTRSPRSCRCSESSTCRCWASANNNDKIYIKNNKKKRLNITTVESTYCDHW